MANGHWMTAAEQNKFGIPTPNKIHYEWETIFYFMDANGIPWGVDAYKRRDGWTEWRARPSAIAKTAAEATRRYGIGAGKFPVTAISASDEDENESYPPNGGVKFGATREILEQSINTFVGERSGSWFWLLLAAAIAWAASRKSR